MKDYALLLHTRTLKFELLPLNRGSLADCRVVILNSGIRHSISKVGDYESRRRAAEDGQNIVRARFGVKDLGEISTDQLAECQGDMSTEAYKRCSHIVNENARTLRCRSGARRRSSRHG